MEILFYKNENKKNICTTKEMSPRKDSFSLHILSKRVRTATTQGFGTLPHYWGAPKHPRQRRGGFWQSGQNITLSNTGKNNDAGTIDIVCMVSRHYDVLLFLFFLCNTILYMNKF